MPRDAVLDRAVLGRAVLGWAVLGRAMVSLGPLALMVLVGACTAPQTPSPDLAPDKIGPDGIGPDGIRPDGIRPDMIGRDEIDWFFDRLIAESRRGTSGQIPDQIPGHMQADPMFGMMRDLQDDAAQAQELQRLLDRLGGYAPLSR